MRARVYNCLCSMSTIVKCQVYKGASPGLPAIAGDRARRRLNG